MQNEWYQINNIEQIDSPALAVYTDRAKENINILKSFVDDVTRLRPHVKTHKSSEISKMLLDAGIKKFKCATIAEAEMLAQVGAPDVLMSYQLMGPKANRFVALIKKYPNSKFSSLIDNVDSAKHLSTVAEKENLVVSVFIDVNVGMNRTGILPEDSLKLYEDCQSLKGILIVGLHAYDGHLRDTDLAVRKKQCDEGYAKAEKLHQQIKEKFGKELIMVAGGTPSFSIHSKRKGIDCSPGTYIYWDKNYKQTLTEQPFLNAALVITRVISKPTDEIITVDLGHKSIASENPLANRVTFLNAPDLQPVGHSEEHLVLNAGKGNSFKVGDVLYGVPYHICPTVALHDRVQVIEDGKAVGTWSTLARNRTITI